MARKGGGKTVPKVKKSVVNVKAGGSPIKTCAGLTGKRGK